MTLHHVKYFPSFFNASEVIPECPGCSKMLKDAPEDPSNSVNPPLSRTKEADSRALSRPPVQPVFLLFFCFFFLLSLPLIHHPPSSSFHSLLTFFDVIFFSCYFVSGHEQWNFFLLSLSSLYQYLALAKVEKKLNQIKY